MLYIHHTSCISPQLSYGKVNMGIYQAPKEGKMLALEPNYDGIPAGMLRRMGKAVRMGVGAAIPLLKEYDTPSGIIIGTANGGMEDCILFLNQIIDYKEGMLTPGNFVQSTPNAIAAQIGFMNRNKGYNITHVQRGLAFEDALTDAVMQLSENPSARYIVGAVEEISTYNYNIDLLAGWYKKEDIPDINLYNKNSAGSIAGEGAALFLADGTAKGATACLHGLETFHSTDISSVEERWKRFIKQQLTVGPVDLLISGENGDNRMSPFYHAIENNLEGNPDIMRFKHLCGEYPTASSFAFWLACRILSHNEYSVDWFKYAPSKKIYRNIAVYNNFKNNQHGFMVIRSVN